ncbi:M56 family metallopeptidase [Streptomyces sp. H10-C2]|uniref:M56 family metallopeptidase n=1 Tax=unclassified Streptomyces TaxID=2593676 RepID=UPI0024BB5CF8|nr:MULTISPECIES: M56 family metallopeptidase [unclassified Streptomyces]MDJ0347324.1 M56 family metallopeptidase [Streptomyces sp. PH10-H1]MDJ0375121.1 M56 family metallopeptidase [Streptomyces sp. H10-C2]
MRLAVYFPLIFPLLAALAARPVADRLHPRPATWLLTTSAVVLAAGSSTVLGLLALSGLVRIPLVASLGHWPAHSVQRDHPASLPVALVAGVLLAAAAAGAVRMVWRRARALFAAALEAGCLPGPDPLVVVEDPAADAYAIPGLPGRIVVSTGMLNALDPTEREVLLAHERAHLRARHHLFAAAAHLAAATNPLLRPVARAVGYTVERWADEEAAAATGDRRRVARTVGKAALAAKHTTPRRRLPAAALGLLGIGRGGPLAGAGPVPRRVAALLAPPPRLLRPLPLLAAAALLAATSLCTLEAAHDLHVLLRTDSTDSAH